MTIADSGGILERLTRMVDLTPDEIPMPQERLGLLPGCSGKAYSDWLQARGDELGNGVAWRHWTRSRPEERRRPSGGSGRKTTVTRRQLTDEQRRLIAPFLPIGKYGPYDISSSAVAPPAWRAQPWPRLRPGRCGSDQGRRPGRPRTHARTDSAHSATGDAGATCAPCGQFAVSAISQVWHTTLRAGIRPDAAPMPTWRVTCT
nr:hypothetical protein [Streptomyces flaveus]